MNAWDLCGLTEEGWLDLPLGVRLRLAASCYLGWGYARDYPHVPFHAPGLPEKLYSVVDRNTNCSTFTASLLMAVYPREAWTAEDYGDLQVYADRLPARPDSPCQAVERHGLGTRVAAPVVGRWHLMQGWRIFGAKPSGHGIFVYARSADLLVLEAATSPGPRWRPVSLGALAREYPAGLYASVLME